MCDHRSREDRGIDRAFVVHLAAERGEDAKLAIWQLCGFEERQRAVQCRARGVINPFGGGAGWGAASTSGMDKSRRTSRFRTP